MHENDETVKRGERALDHDLLLDLHTGRVRFTQTGQQALAARFAQSGVNLWRLRTLTDVQDAIARVTHREFQRLSAGEQADAGVVNAIDDLDFIVDGVTGQPLAPLWERRARREAAFERLLTQMGITADLFSDALGEDDEFSRR